MGERSWGLRGHRRGEERHILESGKAVWVKRHLNWGLSDE